MCTYSAVLYWMCCQLCAVLWSRLILENMAGPKLPGVGAQHHQSSSSASHWGLRMCCWHETSPSHVCMCVLNYVYSVYLYKYTEVKYVYTQYEEHKFLYIRFCWPEYRFLSGSILLPTLPQYESDTCNSQLSVVQSCEGHTHKVQEMYRSCAMCFAGNVSFSSSLVSLLLQSELPTIWQRYQPCSPG